MENFENLNLNEEDAHTEFIHSRKFLKLSPESKILSLTIQYLRGAREKKNIITREFFKNYIEIPINRISRVKYFIIYVSTKGFYSYILYDDKVYLFSVTTYGQCYFESIRQKDECQEIIERFRSLPPVDEGVYHIPDDAPIFGGIF